MSFNSFQSTLPRGERPTPLWRRVLAPQSFNPRSREGSDQVNTLMASGYGQFQSTLPRGERRLQFQNSVLGESVSIHAPARGATVNAPFEWLAVSVSIHAPARGATETTRKAKESLKCFNPRSREGSDPRRPPFGPGIVRFNPRSREGSDGAANVGSAYYGMFQSTLPRGERPM